QAALARRLIALGWSRPDVEVMLRGMRSDVEIFREDNVPIFARLEGMDATYQKITGGLTVDWDGETITIPRLQPYLKDPDRSVRERAFRSGAGAYMEKRDELAALFDGMFALRQQAARNAGFADYEKYSFQSMHRFDYTPDDCRRFHEAVE